MITGDTGGFATPKGEQDTHHNPLPAFGRHCATIHQNGAVVSAKCRRVALEGMGCEVAHLLPCLQDIHPRQHGFNTSQPNVRKKTPSALQHAVWDTLR